MNLFRSQNYSDFIGAGERNAPCRENTAMHPTRKQLSFFVLMLLQILGPTLLVAAQKEGAQDTTTRRLWTAPPRPAERMESGAAKAEWQRWRMIVLSRRLDRNLEDFESSAKWQSFLRLPRDIVVLKNAGGAEEEYQTLQTSLQRFALVARDDHYQQIASLSSFQAAHRALKTYAASRKEPRLDREETPDAETLSSQAQKQADPTNRWAQTPTIYRLPPVLMPGEHPELLTPPQQLQLPR